MALNARQVEAAKGSGKLQKLSDGGGLQLWITQSGSKLWRLAYRYGGKQKLLALGSYPVTSLADARAKRDAQKKVLAEGQDPSLMRKISNANSFDAIADEWLEQQIKRSAEATITKNRWLLSFARSSLGQRPIDQISAAEILAVLRGIEVRGRLESARRARATIGSVFRYAIATARAENDPTIALRGALQTPQVKNRAAIITEPEFGALLRAIDDFDGMVATRIALQLCAILHPRPGELRKAAWSEFDLDERQWSIPAGRMKMRRPHLVPLAPQAIALLTELHSITGKGTLLFPGIRSASRPISDGTLNAALRRMGYTKLEATAHGFRSTFSTLANESGRWSPDAIERHLAHQDANTVRAAYNRGAYWAERVKLANWWANECDRLRAL